ncbi:MAG: hypothetical protein AAF570_28205, partial [Bacteroidota bacterium]
LNDWINLYDPKNRTNFRIFYDIYSTPVIYLLDENKHIKAKRLGVDDLENYLRRELGLAEKKKDEGKDDKKGEGE